MDTTGKAVKKVFKPSTILAPVNYGGGLVGNRWLTFHFADRAYGVFKVQEIPEDGADWLISLIKAGEQPYPDMQQRALDAFAKNSLCGIDECDRLVEVGVHMTFSGHELLIVPCCQWHNSAGTLKNAHIKAYQIYACINLIRDVLIPNDEDGTLTLERGDVPFLLDFGR